MESLSKRCSSRREFVLAVSAMWQVAILRAQTHLHSSIPVAEAGPYTFSFFNKEQRKTLRLLMSCIVPADGRSPGAIGAKVDEYIDFILSHGDAGIQQIWKRGLRSYGSAIDGRSDKDVDRFLEAQCRNEFAPANEDETFFVVLKNAVTEGFYTSETGINQELGYQGMSFQLEFEGCTHRDHHAPADWQPLLQQPKDA